MRLQFPLAILSSLLILPPSLLLAQEQKESTRPIADEYTNISDCKELTEYITQKNTPDFSMCLREAQHQSDCDAIDATLEKPNQSANVLILLDASGSMAGRIQNQTKMSIAKSVIEDFAAELPDYSNIGLLVYGHKGSNQTHDKSKSCAQTELVYGMAPYESSQFSNALNAFSATGWTPIAGALEKAGQLLTDNDSLNTESENLIYIVSDGLETCGGKPEAVASQLNEKGITTHINIIGFDVGSKAQQNFRQIAQQGNGTYFDAKNRHQLETIFQEEKKKLIDNIIKNQECLIDATVANARLTKKLTSEERSCLLEKIEQRHNDSHKEYNTLVENDRLPFSCKQWLIDHHFRSARNAATIKARNDAAFELIDTIQHSANEQRKIRKDTRDKIEALENNN